jgi:hypothetical protein
MSLPHGREKADIEEIKRSKILDYIEKRMLLIAMSPLLRLDSVYWERIGALDELTLLKREIEK